MSKMDQSTSQPTGSVSLEETPDDASSNYGTLSSRSSWSSILSTEHEWPGSITAQQFKRTYSIIDPVRAGVFDEIEPDATTIPRRRPTHKRRVYSLNDARSRPRPNVSEPSATKTSPLCEPSPANASPQLPRRYRRPERVDTECEQLLIHRNEITLSQALEELENQLCNIVNAPDDMQSCVSSNVDGVVMCHSAMSRRAMLVHMASDSVLESKQADLIQPSAAENGEIWPQNTCLKHARFSTGNLTLHSRYMDSTTDICSTPTEDDNYLRPRSRKFKTWGNQLQIWRQSQLHRFTKRYREVKGGAEMRSPEKLDDENIMDFHNNRIGCNEGYPSLPDTVSQDIPELNSNDVSEIRLFELDGSVTVSETESLQAPESASFNLSIDIPENVVLGLMTNVGSLNDLFSYALVNKQFYYIYKRHELSLMKNALFRMSPAAWELREISPPWGNDWYGLEDPDIPVPEYTPTTYLRNYSQDVYALVELKSLVIFYCGSFLRRETIDGLAGTDPIRAAEVDAAIWRICVFCRIFGSGKGREANLSHQIDWLNGGGLARKQGHGATILGDSYFTDMSVLFDPPAGFGAANEGGLTVRQLCDLSELWNCFGVLLLEKVRGKHMEAQEAGVFCNLDITNHKEESMLEEWAYYVLTFGPSVLLRLISAYPNNTASSLFANAEQMRLTQWDPPEAGTSRWKFIREAISRTLSNKVHNFN